MHEQPETHSARILDGRRLATQIRQELAMRAQVLARAGIIPQLVVVLSGDDPASLAYVQTIARTASTVGIVVNVIALEVDASQARVAAILSAAGNDPLVHGVMLQQPLPGHLRSRDLASVIVPEKDVDGANPTTQGHLAIGSRAMFTPATPRAVMELLAQSAGWPITGKHAVVIGKSSVVGIPVALLLMHSGATVTVTHKDTVDLAFHTRQADIIVSAAGVPNLIQATMLKRGVIIIDVGTTLVGDTLCGDVDVAAAQALAAEYTPVPGGVGPVTTATLLANVLDSAERPTTTHTH